MDYNSAAVIATILNAEKELLLPVVALPYPALQTATTLFSWFFQQQGQEQHDFQFFHATISMNEPSFDLQSRWFRIDKDKKQKQDEN